MASIVVGILSGAFGMAYLVYGRKQAKIVAAVSGIMLCVYPYFVDGWLWLTVIGVALLAAPFVFDY